MDYYLSTQDITNQSGYANIIIVGCGGTGGFVAESICRLLTGRKDNLLLVDHDRVEPHNLLRQNFYKEDIGQFKSKALAERLARSYGRTIGYSIHPFSENTTMDKLGVPGYDGYLMIGCVDNARGRAAMNRHISGSTRRWLIDAGNGANWGQVLIGNSRDREMTSCDPAKMFKNNFCTSAPGPALQRPDILTAEADVHPDIDCAQAMDLTDQDPTINGMMAALVTQATRKILAGNCPYMGLYLDMEMGQVTPSYVSPDAVRKVVERIPRDSHQAYANEYDQDDYDVNPDYYEEE